MPTKALVEIPKDVVSEWMFCKFGYNAVRVRTCRKSDYKQLASVGAPSSGPSFKTCWRRAPTVRFIAREGRLDWLYGQEFDTILAILANAALNPQTPAHPGLPF